MCVAASAALVPIAPDTAAPPPDATPPPAWRGRGRPPERRACPRARVFVLCAACGARNHIRCAYCKACFKPKAPVPGAVAATGADQDHDVGTTDTSASPPPSTPPSPPQPAAARVSPPFPPLLPPPSLPSPPTLLPPSLRVAGPDGPAMATAWVLCTWPLVASGGGGGSAAGATAAAGPTALYPPIAVPMSGAMPAAAPLSTVDVVAPPLSDGNDGGVLSAGIATSIQSSTVAAATPPSPSRRGAGGQAPPTAAAAADNRDSRTPAVSLPSASASSAPETATAFTAAAQVAAAAAAADPRTPPLAPGTGPDADASPDSSWSLVSTEPPPLLPPSSSSPSWSPAGVSAATIVGDSGSHSGNRGGGDSGGSGRRGHDSGDGWDIWTAAEPWDTADPAAEAAVHDAGNLLDDILGEAHATTGMAF
ncbi:hypothetical protein MMPV_008321 [Pyropia vietnamensis]